MTRETRVSLRKKTMKYIELALDGYQSVPLSDDKYIDGLGDVVTRTITKENNEYVLYKMEKHNPGVYQRKALTKIDALAMIEKHVGAFHKVRLTEELEYWKECVHFLTEESDATFINSFLYENRLN